MKAIVQESYGLPDGVLRLREIDLPAAGDDDVLVRVRAASVHADVWHVVTGRPYVLRLMGGGFSRPRNPVPGTDMAGIVEAVGRNVKRFRPGDAVFGDHTGCLCDSRCHAGDGRRSASTAIPQAAQQQPS